MQRIANKITIVARYVRHTAISIPGRLLYLALLLACLPSLAAAQGSGVSSPGTAPGAPAGSYPLSNLEHVNLFSGNLNFTMPLLSLGGRGGVRPTVNLSIDSARWKLQRDDGSDQLFSQFTFSVIDVETHTFTSCSNNCGVIYTSAEQTTDRSISFDGSTQLSSDTLRGLYHFSDDALPTDFAGYGPGILQGHYLSRFKRPRVTPPGEPLRFIYSTLTFLTFKSPDGTEYQLRDRLTDGKPKSGNSSDTTLTTPNPRGTVFVTFDGSGVTFISDSEIQDLSVGSEDEVFYPSGFLLLPDGTRYRVENGLVKWTRDRNCNLTTYTYGQDRLVRTITDSLGRTTSINYGIDAVDPTTGAASSYDSITYKGGGEAPREIRVWRSPLSTALRADFPGVESYGSLFPMYDQGVFGSPTYNPSVVRAVELPDHRRYEFKYDTHNELARVVLPTGGAFEYDYIFATGASSLQRRLSERRVYESKGSQTPDYRETYEVTYGDLHQGDNTTSVKAEQKSADGARVFASSLHRFLGHPNAIQHGFYPMWADGKEFQTDVLDPDANDALLRRITYRWQQRAPVSGYTGLLNGSPGSDPRVIETISTLENGLVAKTTAIDPSDPDQQNPTLVGFDQFNNPTDVWEYDYGQGTPGALLRHTRTSYLTVNPSNGADYTAAAGANSVSLRRLPSQQSVFDAAGVERARTSYEYDRYDADQNHAALVPRSDITGLCLTPGADGSCLTPSSASYTTRGNVTATTSYLLDAQGTVTGSISAYGQYDVAGNVVKSIGARKRADGTNIETSFDFADNFGSPDAEARTNSAPAGLGSLHTYAFATKVANALGQSAYTQYDYSTGHVVNIEDANGTVGSVRYDDLLDRPTQAESAVNVAGLHSQVSFAYDDAARKVTTTADLNALGDNALRSESFYDGLGRAVEVRQYETGSQYVATLTKYDKLGRAEQVSNPYRPALGESPVWTTSAFDMLGRVASVTTPDQAVVRTSYDGARVLVTDQAGRQRLSRTDAMGRLAEVWEIRSADAASGTESVSFPAQAGVPAVSAGYRTAYTYDVLGNLCKVEQGGQHRYFYYDSLSRLLRAKMPEQEADLAARAQLSLAAGQVSLLSENNNDWSLAYEYYDDGSLKKRTDARLVSATYVYDELGRAKTRTYNDNTPAVAYTYDDPAVAKSVGRLTKVSSPVSETAYAEYDALGRIRQSRQVTDGQTYQTAYDYYFSGALKSETYPSGRLVSYGYDGVGRLAGVTGQKAGEADKTYASTFAYAASGAISSLKLGNNLWEHTLYNARMQPTQIGLGTSATDSSTLKLDYAYGVVANGVLDAAQNSGDVQSQTITAPGLTLTQAYAYDELNRLQSAQETGGATQVWQQVYKYDRYGNRTLDSGTSKPVLPQSLSLEEPTVNPSVSLVTNRVNSSGYIFDPVGNMTSSPGYIYTYDGEGQMVTADTGQPLGNAAYSYDGDGKRVKKVVGGGASTTVFVYDAAGKLVAEYSNAAQQANGTQYLTSDTLGSPRVVTGEDGAVKSRHDYLPFGEEMGTGTGGRAQSQGYSQPDGTRQRYAGSEHDGEIGLDFMQARYYGSSMGRFTSVDPLLASDDPAIPQSFNRYSYCINNPLKFIDPSGLIWGYKDRDDGMREFTWFDGNKLGKGYTAYTQETYTFADGRTAYLDPKSSFWGWVTNEEPVNQVGVIIWNSTFPDVTHIHGWGGHVSYNINDVSWSWETGGWADPQSFGDYLSENIYRSGTEYVFDGGAEWNKRLAEGIMHAYDNVDNGIVLPGFGGYNLVQNNCGEGFCRAINAMNGLPRDTGISPADHRNYIENNLSPLIKERKYIPRRDVERAPDYLRLPIP
jgi:RHS repeat-associated protein